MKTLAVMRPKNRLDESKHIAEKAGFNTVCASPVEISFNDSPDFETFVKNLRESTVDFLIITSTNGADAMISIVSAKMSEEEFRQCLNGVEVIAIGPVSTRALERAKISVSEIPEEYSSQGIVKLLNDRVSGKTVYILRSDHGDALLSQGLQDAGADVHDIAVYSLTKVRDECMATLAEKTLSGEIDAFAFTSALSAESFIDIVSSLSEDAVTTINCSVVAAIGYPTKAKLESLGVRVDLVPPHATYECMIDSLAELMEKSETD